MIQLVSTWTTCWESSRQKPRSTHSLHQIYQRPRQDSGQAYSPTTYQYTLHCHIDLTGQTWFDSWRIHSVPRGLLLFPIPQMYMMMVQRTLEDELRPQCLGPFRSQYWHCKQSWHHRIKTFHPHLCKLGRGHHETSTLQNSQCSHSTAIVLLSVVFTQSPFCCLHSVDHSILLGISKFSACANHVCFILTLRIQPEQSFHCWWRAPSNLATGNNTCNEKRAKQNSSNKKAVAPRGRGPHVLLSQFFWVFFCIPKSESTRHSHSLSMWYKYGCQKCVHRNVSTTASMHNKCHNCHY